MTITTRTTTKIGNKSSGGISKRPMAGVVLAVVIENNFDLHAVVQIVILTFASPI
jgi:hypothetical protein